MMHRLREAGRKASRVIRKGPTTFRNILFARMGIWPVGKLSGSDLEDLPVYCISLLRATAKRRLMLAQARQLGLRRFEFVDAVDASALQLASLEESGTYDAATSKSFHPQGLTVNEIACSLSHAKVYDLMVRRGDRRALILEDDALFVTRPTRRIRVADFPEGWDVVFLNSFRSPERPLDAVAGGLYGVDSYEGSAAAYVLSLVGALKLSRVATPVVHAADGLVGRCLALEAGQTHKFKQRGARTSLSAYLVYPDAVLNGSTEHYHVSEVQMR